MPSAPPTPPEEQAITIYVAPYVRKYVLARLADPARRLADAKSRELYDAVQRRLQGRSLVQVVNDFDAHTDKPSTRLQLVVRTRPGQRAEINPTVRAHLSGCLTKSYQHEMFDWVNWYRTRLGMSARRALTQFRRHYAITEEDHPFLNEERMYYRHGGSGIGGKQSRRKRAERRH